MHPLARPGHGLDSMSQLFCCLQSFDRAMNHLDKAFGFVSSSHQFISRKVMRPHVLLFQLLDARTSANADHKRLFAPMLLYLTCLAASVSVHAMLFIVPVASMCLAQHSCFPPSTIELVHRCFPSPTIQGPCNVWLLCTADHSMQCLVALYC